MQRLKKLIKMIWDGAIYLALGALIGISNWLQRILP